MAGKGSSAAKLETRPTVHEFRWEKLGRREEVEASSPKEISAVEEARRRRCAWGGGWLVDASTLGHRRRLRLALGLELGGTGTGRWVFMRRGGLDSKATSSEGSVGGMDTASFGGAESGAATERGRRNRLTWGPRVAARRRRTTGPVVEVGCAERAREMGRRALGQREGNGRARLVLG